MSEARAKMMLQRARWAATAFASYDGERTRRVVHAVAEAAYQNAERFARDAVEEHSRRPIDEAVWNALYPKLLYNMGSFVYP